MRRRTFSPASKAPDTIDVGRIVAVFGLKGAVKIQPTTDFPERFEAGRTIFVAGKQFEILDSHWHKTIVRVRLNGVDSIEDAERLVGSSVAVSSDDLPDLEEDEYMISDLLGAAVYSESGEELGVLEEVISAPANDVFRVGSYMIPVVKSFVVSVDVEGRKIVVRLLKGMEGLSPASRPDRR